MATLLRERGCVYNLRWRHGSGVADLRGAARGVWGQWAVRCGCCGARRRCSTPPPPPWRMRGARAACSLHMRNTFKIYTQWTQLYNVPSTNTQSWLTIFAMLNIISIFVKLFMNWTIWALYSTFSCNCYCWFVFCELHETHEDRLSTILGPIWAK